jgi:hypothetical protein
MNNIADFILESYYKNIYPEPLNKKKITIPEEYKDYSGKHPYIKIASAITMESYPEKALKRLHQLATREHIPIEKEIKKEVDFPLGENELISEYSLRVFKDTHALDKGKALRSRLNKFLINLYGVEDLSKHGILENEAASTVWSKNVIANIDVYFGVSLLDVKNIELRKDIPAVWIFENTNTAHRIENEKTCNFPYITTSGIPSKAFHILIKRLVNKNVKLFYHGDMDVAGVEIFHRLQKEYNIFAPFMNINEFNNNSKITPKKKQANKDNLSFLGESIKNRNEVVYEEQLDLKKCQLLYEANSLKEYTN